MFSFADRHWPGCGFTGSSSSYDRHLYLDNAGHVVFGVYPNAMVTIASPTAYTDGQWHLADATLGSTGMRLYLDGTQVASNTTTTTAQNFTGYWRVGYDNLAGWANAPTSYYLNATLDEVAVYPSALTATQITSHYTANHA